MKYVFMFLLPLIVSCTQDDEPHLVYGKTSEVIPMIPTKILDQNFRLNPEGRLEAKSDLTWEALPEVGLPTEIIWPDLENPTPVPLTAFSKGPGTTLAALMPRGVYLTKDAGASWKQILNKETLGNGTYLTAVAMDPLDPLHLIVGTSFKGLFETKDQGKHWSDLTPLYQAQSLGADYWEQVHALAFSQAVPQEVYISLGIKGEIQVLDLKLKKITPLTTLAEPEVIQGIYPLGGPGDRQLEVRTDKSYWKWDQGDNQWTKLGERALTAPWDVAKSQRMAKSANRYGLYVSGNQATSPTLLSKHFTMMKSRGLNTLVVDFKDDIGQILYESKVEMAQKVGAIRKRLNVPELVAKVHEAGFYLIARVVVFKDDKLYAYNNNKYALWNNTTKKPWGYFKEVVNGESEEKTYVQKEFWVDVYSQDVWDYNIAIAKELEGLGIDEIQFDYIRFPSDGPTAQIVNRFAVKGMTRVNALESFLKKARSQLTLPLSVDIFGFNGFFPMEYLGQNSPMIARYADAISPMFYPSHFSTDFFGKTEFMARAKKIYFEGTHRSNLMNNGLVHVRSWVQAFLLGDERNFTDPQIKAYLRNQLEGAQAGGGNGWLLWNASNNYYMVREDLKEFQTKIAPKTSLPYTGAIDP